MDHQISQLNSARGRNTPGIAKVAFPIAVPGVYDYQIPGVYRGKVQCGMPVLVSLKRREVWGVVVGLSDTTNVPGVKEILTVQTDAIDPKGQSLFSLYEWMAVYYQCDIGRVFKPFLRKGVVAAKPKTVTEFVPVVTADKSILNGKYQAVLSLLQSIMPCTAIDALEQKGITRSSLDYLRKHGYLDTKKRLIVRKAYELRCERTEEQYVLTEEQRCAVQTILREESSPSKPFLLYGITGSGKTHVYTTVAARMISQGKGVIILVPEISLTPQTIQRFRAALGEVLTVIHSHMSDGERRDSLKELVTGKKRVVIGVRSAVLAPIRNLGCIIVDEEHDASYKQSDMDPRYHARDVAVMRGRLQHALVILGSATPALESYYNAQKGKYALVTLNNRFGAATLPQVSIVDMRLERERNNWTPISGKLSELIAATLEKKRQIILLMNRRGFSTVMLCEECGYTAECPHCSVTLRYHRADTSLKCHICGFMQPAPQQCPSCKGEKIKYSGTGIQRVEEVVRESFPEARMIRMDQDSTRKNGAHAKILEAFAHKKADILLGTQMVAKGLNFPGVALVGVLAADTGLHIPDFRASERTFQLLTQVAGRAGRTDSNGVVVIQTHSPDDRAITCASTHDYLTFYEQELQSRESLSYPPFSRLVRVVLEGSEEHLVMSTINRIASQIRSHLKEEAFPILGPVPAVVERIRGEVRHTLLIKSFDHDKCGKVLRTVRKMNGKLPSSLKLIVDIDPVNML